jgi:hypothetical protein
MSACPLCGNEYAGAFHCAECGWSESVVTIALCPHCGDYLFNGRHKGNVERWCLAKRAHDGDK